MSSQTQKLVASQGPKRDVLVSKVRTQVERVLILHTQPFAHETQPGYPLEDAVKELTEEIAWASVGSPSRAYRLLCENEVYRRGKRRDGEDDIPRHRLRSGANLGYNDDDRYATDENRRGR